MKVLIQQGNDWTDGNYLIKQTSPAQPEQYDMLDKEGSIVGYFRLRHGTYTVEYPDVCGEVLVCAYPQGDGCFDCLEREYWITLGYLKIIQTIGGEAISKIISDNLTRIPEIF